MFPKSSHDFEHFYNLSFFHTTNTFRATGDSSQGRPNGAQSGAGQYRRRCTAGAGRGDYNFERGGAGQLKILSGAGRGDSNFERGGAGQFKFSAGRCGAT